MCFGTWAGTGRGTYLPPDKESKGYRKILLTMIFKKHFRKKWPGLAFFSGKSEREKFPEKINSSQQIVKKIKTVIACNARWNLTDINRIDKKTPGL